MLCFFEVSPVQALILSFLVTIIMICSKHDVLHNDLIFVLVVTEFQARERQLVLSLNMLFTLR